MYWVCNIGQCAAIRASVLLIFISARTCGLIRNRLVLEESNSHRTVPFNGDLLMQGGCLPLPTVFVLHDFLSFSFFNHRCSCFLANVKLFPLNASMKHMECDCKKGEENLKAFSVAQCWTDLLLLLTASQRHMNPDSFFLLLFSFTISWTLRWKVKCWSPCVDALEWLNIEKKIDSAAEIDTKIATMIPKRPKNPHLDWQALELL